MTRYVAFLRGINLGKRRVKMADLRRHASDLGLDGVATFIASGNVIFDHDELSGAGLSEVEQRMEAHFEERLGFFTDTMIRTVDDVAALCAMDVVAEAEAAGLNAYATFAKNALTDGIREAFTALETPDDRFHFREREVLWLRAGGVSDSAIETRHLEKAFDGMPNTRRKVSALRRMVQKFQSGEEP